MSPVAEKVKMRDVAPTGVRISPELKAKLIREAAVNGRTLHAEILLRLQASLDGAIPTGHASATVETGTPTKSPADPLSETDRAMLGVFRRMPVEKQLALLSLFK